MTYSPTTRGQTRTRVVNREQLQSAGRIYASGATYPHRRQISAAGGRWNPARSLWEFRCEEKTEGWRDRLWALVYSTRKRGVRWRADPRREQPAAGGRPRLR